MDMFCYQCEQTAQGVGCTKRGVCGKSPEASALQDLIVHACKGIAQYAHRARRFGVKNNEVDRFVLEALFTTLTNVNFDERALAEWLARADKMIVAARADEEYASTAANATSESLTGPAQWRAAEGMAGLLEQAQEVAITERIDSLGADRAALQELITYGIKGLAAYAHHAALLGQEDDGLYAFVYRALDALCDPDPSVDSLLGLALETGEANLRAMELLDAGHTSHFGHPEPTAVRIHPVKGKAILVSGHDLIDLEELLKQTEGKGINIYTHGEMLPAHAYPGLKKYAHLVGNYGGAWQDQVKEFAAFPGSIVMTTNCIQRPADSYRDRIFTCGPVGWPGVAHLQDRDFGPAIEAAQAAPGFAEDGPDSTITIGFAHHAVMNVADKVVDAVQQGAIRHFFLVGGCDGAKPGRNYFTKFAEAVPDDCVILTLACGKYRFNKLDFGDIGGIPRLLDVGQCNDAYSAVQIAVALAKAFDTDVNSLPLSIICSWYEQKAVAILLTLLHLGITDIRLGPSLPAFVTPAILEVLVDKFGIKPIDTPEKDLDAILNA